MTVPTIVVIGGSFAGYTVLQTLDKTLKTKANLILIEERESFYLTIAALRSVVEPGFAEHTWISYSNLFVHNSESKVIKSRALSVSDKEVILANGEKVAYDYLVISTGSRIPSPGGTLQTTQADYVKETDVIRAAIEKANSIAIVGGGVVGVELAGEIATEFPGKKVSIIPLGQLEALGVKTYLNSRVISSKDGSGILPNNAPYNLAPHILETTNGEKISSDIQFLTTGTQKPNSDFVASFLPLDSRGYIEVEATGQVKGHNRIFSLGDVSTLDDLKLAYLAFSVQAPIVCANIVSLLTVGNSATLKQYKKAVPGQFGIITIGRNGGVTQTPFGTFGPWLTVLIKSKGLFMKAKHSELRQELKYTGPKK
ncbi:hypothetical protein BDR26DRAFT_1009881 [Obelidium mucronatum]|nr:hypothetical protein BDR26DRAFT_1009881 [Obelidium mucronatum]